ncbi:MAG TPA: hypothetical protein VF384_08070 [Planctomycetota bacterium]
MLPTFLIHVALAATLPMAQPVLQEPSRIVVLDAATGRPTANATVWIVDRRHPSRFVKRDPLVDDATYLTAAGRVLHADAEGNVAVPADLEPVQIGARAGARWGMVLVPTPTPPRIVLTLGEDPVVDVNLVDREGKPAAVTASAWRVYPQRTGLSGTARLRGDARGVAPFHPAALFSEAYYGQKQPGRIDDGALVQLQLDLVALQPVLAALDERALPTQVTLVAPEVGTVLVRATTSTDQPLLSGFAHLSAIDAKMSTSDAKTPAAYVPGQTVPIVDGVARFPAVALGLRLRLQIQNGQFQRGRLDTELVGPTTAGQVVEHRARVPDGRADGMVAHDVLGRLRTATGLPIADRRVVATVRRNGALHTKLTAWGISGLDGGFTLQLVDMFEAGDEVVIAVSGEAFGSVLDHVVVQKLAVDRAETVVGGVVPQPAALLCSGRIVDAQGNPVCARLSTRCVGKERESIELALPGAAGVTDHTGRFAVYAAAATTARVELCVTPPGRHHVPVQTIVAGSKDVVVTVPTTRTLEGRVMLASAHAANVLTALLVPTDTYDRPSHDLLAPVSAPIAADGSFVTAPTLPGSYHLLILLADAFEVAKVEAVVVSEQGPLTDARLQAIDLLAALRAVTVQVEANGHSIDGLSELRIAPRAGSLAFPQMRLPAVVAELRPRPLRVWLPKGDFVATAQIGDVTSTPVTIEGDTVTIKLPK